MLNKGSRRARSIARAFVAAALPRDCALCARETGDAALCAACAASIAMPAGACPSCALPSPGGAGQLPEGGRALGQLPALCGRCLAHPPAWDAAVAAGAYAFPLDRLVMRLKYAADLPLAATLGESLARAAAACGAIGRVDALVPMPLAPARQRERGFNQAREIARAIAEASGLPVVDALRRTRHAVPQASLAWRERARNVRGAFAVRGSLDRARVALVDDVMTSGATAAAASSALRRAGAARIEAWVVARTLPA
jgi:ComF family protein